MDVVKPSSTEFCQTEQKHSGALGGREGMRYERRRREGKVSARQQHLISSDPVSVCSDLVMPAKYVRDLGIYINCDMSMKTHVSRTVSSCFAALR